MLISDNSLRSPLIAGFNVIFGVITGVIATMFHEELTSAFPLVYFTEGFSVKLGDWNWLVFWFWVFLIAFAYIWTSREALAAKDRKREVDGLTELIESVPPPDFLELYEKSYARVFDLGRQAANSNALDVDIRWILDAMIQLASRWDYRTSASGDVYRANVMIFLPDKAVWAPEFQAHAHQCYGEDHWPAVYAQADGGLYVDKTLATADEVDGEPDEEIAPLLLAYSSADTPQINIGGAPRAFGDGATTYVRDTSELWIDFPSGLPGGSKGCVQSFYTNDTKAKSIISLPIPGESQLIGVLNIYRNSPNIMGSLPRAINFGRLMGPFLVTMGRLVESHRENITP